MDIFEKTGVHKIVGLLDSNKQKGTFIFSYKILGGMDLVPQLLEDDPALKFFVAIGDNWKRSLVVKELRSLAPTIEFTNAIHPSAILGKEVALGKGVIIMAGAIINADSYLGDFTIINTKSSVGHDSTLKEFSSLAPNCTLGGNVEIGKFSAISISTTILHGKKIGEHAVIGAGSLVVEDTKGFAVHYGSPAKFIRSREKGEKYL